LAYLLFVIADDIADAPQADVEEFVLRRACVELVRLNTTPAERFEIWRDPVIPTETGVQVLIDANGQINDNRWINKSGTCIFDRVTSSYFSTHELVQLRVIQNGDQPVILPIADTIRPNRVSESGRVDLAPIDWVRYWFPVFEPDYTPSF